MGRLALRPALRAYAHAPAAVVTGWQNTNSVNFDGTDAYIDLSTTQFIATDAAWTVSAWFKLDNLTTTYPVIIALKTDDAQNWRLIASSGATYKDIAFGLGSGTYLAACRRYDFGMALDTWYHAAVAYNGSGITTSGNYALYIDGAAVTHVSAGGFGADTGNSKIGDEGSTNYFDGLLDNISIFSSELSAANVAAIYNSGAPRDLEATTTDYPQGVIDTLVSWWRLGGGSGDALGASGILDSAGSNHGTATNMLAADLTNTDVPT